MNLLSDEDYCKQLELSKNSPIPTADFVLVRHVHEVREFLLSARTQAPYKGQYFVPGGKIIGSESVEEAVRRNLLRELGVTGGQVTFIGHLTVKNPPKMGIRWLSLWHFHVVEVSPDLTLDLNCENARVKWFTHISPRWPVPVRQALEMAGFSVSE